MKETEVHLFVFVTSDYRFRVGGGGSFQFHSIFNSHRACSNKYWFQYVI